MKIRIGFEMTYRCDERTTFVFMLNVHPSRATDLLRPDQLLVTPNLPATSYFDAFGNVCTRVVAPAGEFRIATDTVVLDTGEPDRVNWDAPQHPIDELPAETLQFLIGSRYCETDRLLEFAWKQFGNVPEGWARVQAICDFVHAHLEFGYPHANVARTALGAFTERRGVCRDFAHLAVTLTRCMNIPARYCTGYLGDIGVPIDPAPMDFSAWFEAYLGGRWVMFDPTRLCPIDSVVRIAVGRDAKDVAFATMYGPATMLSMAPRIEQISGA